MRTTPHVNLFLVLCFVLAPVADALASEPHTYVARDTLRPKADSSSDAQACIDAFCWKTGPFDVAIRPVDGEGEDYGYVVSFPSPFPTGDRWNDTVSLEWYVAQPPESAGAEAAGAAIPVAPAVLVIHESGTRMEAGKMFARSFQKYGLHAFMIHLPYYGERRGDRKRPEPSDLVGTMRQGIADTRRARDAIAAIPQVDADNIVIQGTSLGGFVATTAASLDGCFDATFIMLAGADLYDLIMHGKQDTQKLRERLAAAGIDGDELKDILRVVEPTRVAHRLDPETTWLYSALQDDVVPIQNARRLARAARLARPHHVEMVGGHYSAALYFPLIVKHIVERVRELTP